MKKEVLIYTIFAFVIAICFFLFLALFPRTYNVPHLQKRQSTQYWILSTGSKIGFTLVPAIGDKKQYPIIFLQGGPGGCITDATIESFKPLSKKGYDIYLYDQIGSGLSDRLVNIKEYTANRHERDLEEIIKKIGAKKVILIGQSWGATLATLFISDNPDKVEKLILTSPAPIFPRQDKLSNITPPDSLNLREPQFSLEEAEKKISSLRFKVIFICARNFGLKLASDREVDDFQTLLSNELNKITVCDTSKAQKSTGGNGFYAFIMTTKSLSDLHDPRPKLRNSKMPILILKGQCDYFEWGFVTEYLDIFPNHKLTIIPNAGHSISVEQPTSEMSAICDFLNN